MLLQSHTPTFMNYMEFSECITIAPAVPQSKAKSKQYVEDNQFKIEDYLSRWLCRRWKIANSRWKAIKVPIRSLDKALLNIEREHTNKIMQMTCTLDYQPIQTLKNSVF